MLIQRFCHLINGNPHSSQHITEHTCHQNLIRRYASHKTYLMTHILGATIDSSAPSLANKELVNVAHLKPIFKACKVSRGFVSILGHLSSYECAMRCEIVTIYLPCISVALRATDVQSTSLCEPHEQNTHTSVPLLAATPLAYVAGCRHIAADRVPAPTCTDGVRPIFGKNTATICRQTQ